MSPSNRWSCGTLADGVKHVETLDDEHQLQMELQDESHHTHAFGSPRALMFQDARLTPGTPEPTHVFGGGFSRCTAATALLELSHRELIAKHCVCVLLRSGLDTDFFNTKTCVQDTCENPSKSARAAFRPRTTQTRRLSLKRLCLPSAWISNRAAVFFVFWYSRNSCLRLQKMRSKKCLLFSKIVHFSCILGKGHHSPLDSHTCVESL